MLEKLCSVLITGANRGIGLALVRQLANVEQPPRYIFAGCRNPSKAKDLQLIAEEASQKTAIKLIQLDVTRDEDIKNAVKEIESIVGDNGLNLLINNAGVLGVDGSLFPSVNRTVLQEHFDVNVNSAILVTQAMFPLIKKATVNAKEKEMSIRAAVVNISAVLGSIGLSTMGSKQFGFSYKCSKAALNMFTKCLSTDLVNDDILCISVCPGWVQTDMGSAHGQAELTVEQSASSILSTLCKVNKQHNGGFINRNGEPIAW